MNLKAQQVDYLNIGLIFISMMLAIAMPFKAFVYAYAFVGPLHYLTEINWLSEKNFFTKKKTDFWILGVLCVLITLSMTLSELPKITILSDSIRTLPDWLTSIHDVTKNHRIHLMLIGFFSALSFVLFESWIKRGLLILSSVILALLLNGSFGYILIAGLLIPTLIHVSLFTGLFMLFGAIKSGNKSGYWVCATYVLCALFIVVKKVHLEDYTLDKDLADIFSKGNFHMVNYELSSLFETYPKGGFKILREIPIRIQTFIAFAYIYHYLNWFSKTSIIGWHKVSTKKNIITACLWLASIAFYLIDYKLGFTLLLFLSFLHVFLEFPLNHISIIGIGKAVFSKKAI